MKLTLIALSVALTLMGQDTRIERGAAASFTVIPPPPLPAPGRIRHVLRADRDALAVFDPVVENKMVLFKAQNGSIFRLPSGEIEGTLRYAWGLSGDGYTYRYFIQSPDVKFIQLNWNDTQASSDTAPTATQPDPWKRLGFGWVNLFGEGTGGGESEFQITSDNLPGPALILLKNGKARSNEWQIERRAAGMRQGITPTDNQAMGRVFLNNGTQIWGIGPLIPPGLTAAELTVRVRRWVTMGLAFVRPLADAGVSAEAIDALQPSTDYEREVVACLRRALDRIR